MTPTPEPILDPDRVVVDPHHHLWPGEGRMGPTQSGARAVYLSPLIYL